jgi:hypothetical protein
LFLVCAMPRRLYRDCRLPRFPFLAQLHLA